MKTKIDKNGKVQIFKEDIKPMRSAKRNVRKFDKGGSASPDTKTEVENLGSVGERAKRAYDYLVSNGLSAHHSIGVVANLLAESSELDPNSFNPENGGNGAYGLAQWRGERQKELKAKYGDNPTFDQQLEFLLYELNGGGKGWGKKSGSGSKGTGAHNYYIYSKDEFFNSSNYNDATIMISQGFEKPSRDHLNNRKRVAYAHALHNALIEKPEIDSSNEYHFPTAKAQNPYGSVDEELSKHSRYMTQIEQNIGVGSKYDPLKKPEYIPPNDYSLNPEAEMPYDDFIKSVIGDFERVDGRANDADERISSLLKITEYQQEQIKELQDAQKKPVSVRDDSSYVMEKKTLSPEEKRQNDVNFVLSLMNQMKLPEN